MMLKLLEWSKAGPDRHFIVRKVGTCIETHWRVAVWEKPEGEPDTKLAGHGSSRDLEAAIERAIQNLGVPVDHHRPSAFWYAPRRWCSEFAEQYAQWEAEAKAES